MKDKIKAIETYLGYFPNDVTAKNNLIICKYADEFDIELGENHGYYPRVEYGYCKLSEYLMIGKKCHILNSATNYKFDGNESLLIVSFHAGRLEFVPEAYWYNIEDEWKELMDVLKSYNPLDYDVVNNAYVYGVETGKKLIKDNKKIFEDFREKTGKKIRRIKVERKTAEMERLTRELEKLKCEVENE